MFFLFKLMYFYNNRSYIVISYYMYTTIVEKHLLFNLKYIK